MPLTNPLKTKAGFGNSVVLLTAVAAGVLFSLSAFAGPSSFEQRKSWYLEGLPAEAPGSFAAAGRLFVGGPVELWSLERELAHIWARRDCSDFYVAGLVRLLYIDRERGGLSPEVREAASDAVLGFKYWIDEPGLDSMCYWSENHQVIFHSDEYLVGALFPERVFANDGRTGREHMELARSRLERWFDWRERFGFSEWLSNVYYDEDLYALLNLVDFAPDPELRLRASLAVDQLALNLALNSFRGQVRGTHGRTYEKNMLTSAGDDIRQFVYLLWGVREFTPDLAAPSRSGVALATSSYQLPPALECIGTASDTIENYQSHGLSLEEAPAHGLAYDDLEAGMFFWGMGMYSHHRVIDLTARMWRKYQLEENRFFMGLPRLAEAVTKKTELGPIIARLEIASEAAFLDDAHTYTYRTPDYQLSSALDFRPGKIGGQQMTWSAVLGPDAFIFTTYPGRTLYGSPGKWTGNGSNPRIGQYRNVLVAIYNAPLRVTIGETWRYGYSHAWVPGGAFDEVAQKGNWVFARKGDGYAALYSFRRPYFNQFGDYAGSELMAWGRSNVWICELGRAADDGSFEEFMARVLSAEVRVSGLRVSYASPSRGLIEFGWEGPFLAGGREVPLRRDFRYDNPYVRAPRFSRRLDIECGGSSLVLDFENQRRIISAP